MSDVADLGGDSPCWAHLFYEGDADEMSASPGPPIIDLRAAPSVSGGAIWSLPHGGDLDANLIRLSPQSEIGAHVNDEVDVLVVVQTGTGELLVDGHEQELSAEHLVLIPKGSRRSIVAGSSGITYLSIHRRRGPLRIKSTQESRHP